MIPNWVVNKRLGICKECSENETCNGKFSVLQDQPKCPLNKMPNVMEEIANRAWPKNAPRLSGCCDSALNYGDS